MLKNRLIPVLFLQNGYLVRSETFSNHKKLGNPVAQLERYNDWDVDELIYIDITKDGDYRDQRTDLGGSKFNSVNSIEDIIKEIASKCFMPITFGGGIRTLEDARIRFELGADKITINSQAIREPEIITSLAEEFGSQAVIVSIDALQLPNKKYAVYSNWGAENTGKNADEWAREAQERGAGEIFINSISADGTASGYDLSLIRLIVESTSIPVIACGGVGDYSDFEIAIQETGVTAVAAGNIFNFKELSYPLAKKHLKNRGLNFR